MQNRAKARMKSNAHQRHRENVENIVYIDGRNNKDTLLYNCESLWREKAKGSEFHLTFTKEMGYESEYLTHRTIPVTGAVLAEVASVLEEFNSMATLKTVLDNNMNTSCEAGLVTLLEKKI